MRLSFNADELAFQKEVRDWITANMPAEVAEESRRSRTSHVSKERLLQWQRKLAGRGWLCPNWPKEYGGPGWSSTEKFIFEMEMARADSPYLSSFSIKMVAPVLMKYGSAAQKKRFLPKIAAAEELWCQGYSEPGSGSDLASLRTKAERQGDHFIVNGQKIWTTNAHFADWIFCLVRTSSEGKPQDGISFVLLDSMQTPGLTVKPIITLAGDHEVNQVFFDNVRVPKANRIGPENAGWTVAKHLLEYERGGEAYTPNLYARIEDVRRIAREEAANNGGRLIDQPEFARKLAETEISIQALETIELQVLSDLSQGKNPGAISSAMKVRGSETLQFLDELGIEALAHYAAPFEPEARALGRNEPTVTPDYALTAMPLYLNNRAATIYAGSSEVQRNILAKAMLGL